MPVAMMVKQIENYPVEDRVMMADAIIASLNGVRPEYEEAWADVAELRLAELRLGKVKGVAGAEVFTRARRLCRRFMILAAEFLAVCSLTGCLGEDENAVLSDFQKQELFDSLQGVWPKCVANSDSCNSADVLSKFDDGCRKSFEELRKLGYGLKWVYKLTDWYVLELRGVKDGRIRYCGIRRDPRIGTTVYKVFDLQDGMWLNIDAYAGSLRYAPIAKDTIMGFTEMWDSRTDEIVRVPDGFHGLIQGGSGTFLLRKDSDGAYYRWTATTDLPPEKWKYALPPDGFVRSSFFVATSSDTGKSYAFAAGLNPIPNSEGALGISPKGAYKGRHVFAFWKKPGTQTFYYAWPEKDSAEHLSNGTETFGGRPVRVKDGKLVVSSLDGDKDIFDEL